MVVNHVDRRIIGARVFVRGKLLNPRKHLFAVFQKIGKPLNIVVSLVKIEGVAAIVAIGNPILHLPWVERGLRTICRRAPNAHRFPVDRIVTFRNGHIVMQGQPQHSTGPGGVT